MTEPLLYTFSSLKAFTVDTIMKNIMKIKGNAAATEAVCKASNPPDKSNTVANAACAIPHKYFFLFGGSNFPRDVNILNTNIDELDDVIKNVHNKTTVIIDNIFVRGRN